MRQKTLGSIISTGPKLGERQIRIVVSTEQPDRENDVLLMSGAKLANYRKNPIVLANHDRNAPIGTAQVEIKSGRMEALITFAPAGASECADEMCALAKSGVVSAASIGFMPLAQSPRKGGGMTISEFELYEISLVSVPCNAEATILQRSLSSRRSVFDGRTVSAKSTERDRRRRAATALGLKHSPAGTMTAADRKADLARLKAKAITPPSADLAGPAFAHVKAADLAADNLARSAKAYASAPASEAQRLGDLARLGR